MKKKCGDCECFLRFNKRPQKGCCMEEIQSKLEFGGKAVSTRTENDECNQAWAVPM